MRPKGLAANWVDGVLVEMPFDAIVDWIRGPGFPTTEEAIARHLAGVDPSELGFSWEDRDITTLATRLTLGHMTVEHSCSRSSGAG
jgi:hypothetical protein